MKTYLIIATVLFLLIPVTGHCFVYPEDEKVQQAEAADSVYQKADEMPVPLGGMEAILKNVRYPEEAKKAGIEGKVLVSAVIDEKGNVVKVTVKRSAEKSLDEAAAAALKQTKFLPAKMGGKAVKIEIVLPVVFKLDGKKNEIPDDSHPFPVGGMEAIMKNIVYPPEAKSAGTQGKVLIRAVVDKTGEILETSVLKSLSEECDAVALKAVRAVKYTPAKKDGAPVKAEIVIPIMFKLQ